MKKIIWLLVFATAMQANARKILVSSTAALIDAGVQAKPGDTPVPYTHLTLPTNREV